MIEELQKEIDFRKEESVEFIKEAANLNCRRKIHRQCDRVERVATELCLEINDECKEGKKQNKLRSRGLVQRE